ncbi:MAG: apbE [Moraxellaceae bacterium]|jgi:thiamine biosynthesis lipoprotein|nr:apbE [Moraxellaceae bacterium]
MALRSVLLGVAASLVLAGCASAPPRAAPPLPVTLGGVAFSSMQWQVKLGEIPSAEIGVGLHRDLQEALDSLDGTLSTYRPDSELMRFNRHPVGEWLPVSPPLLRGVVTAIEVGVLSQGAYDITVGPLVELWGFGASTAPAAMPSAEAIAAARAALGARHIRIDRDRHALVRLRDIRLDLSSLGEGAGVDALAAVLERAGVESYLVTVAGTARVRGVRPDGDAWQMAIEQPDGNRLPARRLQLADHVVSTSGAYRNFREIAGRRYSHTIDPETGYPVTHAGVSVTVVLPATAGAQRADALATAFNVLGPDRGLALAGEQGLAVLYIERAGEGLRERWSPAFEVFLSR